MDRHDTCFALLEAVFAPPNFCLRELLESCLQSPATAPQRPASSGSTEPTCSSLWNSNSTTADTDVVAPRQSCPQPELFVQPV